MPRRNAECRLLPSGAFRHQELFRTVNEVGIGPGENSEDMQFTLETVNCLGACALAPIMVVDGEYYGQTTMKKVEPILKKYQDSHTEELKQ